VKTKVEVAFYGKSWLFREDFGGAGQGKSDIDDLI